MYLELDFKKVKIINKILFLKRYKINKTFKIIKI